MKREWLQRRLHAGILIVAAALLPACGGSDGPSSTVFVETCVEFSAAVTPTDGTIVARAGADSTCQLAVVEFVATGVTDVFALDTVITYDTEHARLSGSTTSGSFLRSDGADLLVIITEDVAGSIDIGVSRVASTGLDVTDTRLLATLFFVRGGTEGSGDITMEDECVLGSEEPPLPRTGLPCSGGTLSTI